MLKKNDFLKMVIKHWFLLGFSIKSNIREIKNQWRKAQQSSKNLIKQNDRQKVLKKLTLKAPGRHSGELRGGSWVPLGRSWAPLERFWGVSWTLLGVS